jgi:hypothetical protein
MEDCHLENLGDLLHLRYLKLTCPGISGLPKKKNWESEVPTDP